MFNLKKLITIFIVILIELGIYLILYFTVSSEILQSTISAFLGIELMIFLGIFIAFIRVKSSARKQKDLISWVGEEIIQKHMGDVKKINKNQLINIKKAEYIYFIFYLIFLVLFSVLLLSLSLLV